MTYTERCDYLESIKKECGLISEPPELPPAKLSRRGIGFHAENKSKCGRPPKPAKPKFNQLKYIRSKRAEWAAAGLNSHGLPFKRVSESPFKLSQNHAEYMRWWRQKRKDNQTA